METPEKTRYTDEELQEFRTLILEKLQQAQASYEQLTAALEADESNPAYKVMEEGATTLNKEQASQRAQRQMEFINKLKAALLRIDNGSYGICRITGKLIPKGRLLAVPHATTSIEGKEIEQKRRLRPS